MNNKNFNFCINTDRTKAGNSFHQSGILHTQESSIEKIKLSDISKNLFTEESGSQIKTLKMFRERMKLENQFKTIKNLNERLEEKTSTHSSTKIFVSNPALSTCAPGGLVQIESDRKLPHFKQIRKSMQDVQGLFAATGINAKLSTDESKKTQFCPFCPHCNQADDPSLEQHLYNIRESKNILSKAVEYIAQKVDFTQNSCDLNSFQDSDKAKLIDSSSIESLLTSYQKPTASSRGAYKLISNYMNALLDEKISLEEILTPEQSEMIHKHLIANGQLFDEVDNEVFFDKDLEGLFDDKTKEIITTLFRKKYLPLLKQAKRENEEKSNISRKKFLILFMIFLQTLSDLSLECKERATLLYKLFRTYFVEVEKKWLCIVNEMKEKIKYYKDLCKTVIQQKHKHLEKIEALNDVLFSNKITSDNLQSHKTLIQDLVKIINDKRDEIYLLKADIEIVKNELRFWVYDYDSLKLNKAIRNEMAGMNLGKLSYNVNEEMKHKNLHKDYRSLLVNADLYLLLSGQRSYFYDQKEYYLSEIARLTEIFQKAYVKKRNYKKKMIESEFQYRKTLDENLKEVNYLRERIACDKNEIAVQTDIDVYEFNKLKRNNDLVILHKRLTSNKLIEYVEKIQYGCSKLKPLSKKSLLILIPDIYSEKMIADYSCEKEGTMKSFFDEFFIRYMTSKFKLKQLIKKNSEETVMAVLSYCKEDQRIDTFRRFLGIGENKIRREVLDVVLIILKGIPISYYKLFYDEDYRNYLMTTEYCFEFYNSRLNLYNLVSETMSSIIASSIVFDISTNEKRKIKEEQKKDYFFLSRFYSKSFIFIRDLMDKYKSRSSTCEPVNKFSDMLQVANKEFNLSTDQCREVFSRNFQMTEDNVMLENFFEFFMNKYIFKVKITDFLEISLSTLLTIFSNLEKTVIQNFSVVDNKKTGFIYYKEFIELTTKLIGKVENRWKLNEYFKKACGSADKDFISKDEFMTFVLNSDDFLTSLIAQYVNNKIM